MILTKEIAQKVRDTVDAGLCRGQGKPIPGQMCVEAAVNYAMGLPHGDNPSCVGSAVRAFKIALNDSIAWTSNAARANGLRRVAIAQLGSDKLDQIEFSKLLALETVRQIVPIALRNVATLQPALATQFDNLAIVCEKSIDLKDARAAADAAVAAAYAAADAAYAAAAYADAHAARAARAYAAAAHAAHAAHAARAAYAAAGAGDSAAAAAAAAAAIAAINPDKILTLSAEIAVQILIKMGCQGCEWLDLVPLEVV